MSKQVLVIRKDLKMRKGKMVSQGAHAAMKPIFDMMTKVGNQYILTIPDTDTGDAIEEWIDGIFTKITCSVNSLEELEELEDKAKSLEVPVAKITDAGKTEFHGVPTITALAIGPDEDEKINKITGHLPLL